MSQMTNCPSMIDTTGLRCPLPLLKIRKDLKLLKIGETVLIIADDPLIDLDLRHFCCEQGFPIKSISHQFKDDKMYYEITLISSTI